MQAVLANIIKAPQPFTTVTRKLHQGLPKSAVHRFRAPFLCSFLLEKQKKGEQNNTSFVEREKTNAGSIS
jgi:hypothetical protein